MRMMLTQAIVLTKQASLDKNCNSCNNSSRNHALVYIHMEQSLHICTFIFPPARKREIERGVNILSLQRIIIRKHLHVRP